MPSSFAIILPAWRNMFSSFILQLSATVNIFVQKCLYINFFLDFWENFNAISCKEYFFTILGSWVMTCRSTKYMGKWKICMEIHDRAKLFCKLFKKIKKRHRRNFTNKRFYFKLQKNFFFENFSDIRKWFFRLFFEIFLNHENFCEYYIFFHIFFK